MIGIIPFKDKIDLFNNIIAENGLSQTHISKVAGMDLYHLNKILRKKKPLTEGATKKIEHALRLYLSAE